jgi:uncharacterized protein (TIGR00730 family)
MGRKIVTVFGSSLPKPGASEYETAYELGKELALNGFDVCSGGFQGIMDAVSKGATSENGNAIGITVDLFNAIPSEYLTTEIKCNTLFERIDKLITSGDAFIILPGGTGTLVELSLVWEMMNKKIIEIKPIICYGKMWESIVKEMEERTKLEGRTTGLVKCVSSAKECLTILK